MPRLPLLLPRELEDSSVDDEPLIPSLERLGESLMPESRFESRDDELELDDELRLEPEEPEEALMPSSSRDVARSLPLVLLLPDEPLVEALRPCEPERSCELPSPELVLPDAPSPSLRLLLSPTVLDSRSLPVEVRSLLVELRSLLFSVAL